MEETDFYISRELYGGFFSSLLSGRQAECRDTVQCLLEGSIPIRELYTGLFQAALYQVGELWEKNKISVAVEHLATSIIEGLLPLVYPRLFAAEHCGKKAIVSCVANEYHQIGGKMVADLFELNSWDSFFLGANTPMKDLLELIESKNPDVVGLSVSVSFNTGKLIQALEGIRKKWDHLPIIVGGQAFRFGGAEMLRDYPEVNLIEGLDELESYISTRN